MRILGRIAGLLILLAAAVLTGLYFYRPGLDQYAAHRYVSPPARAGALTLTWFGVTGVLLSDGEHAVMIDPFFTRPEGLVNLAANRSIAPDEALIARELQAAGVSRLDAVLVSHSHYDHAMDAGVVARLTGAPLLGSPSTLNIGRGAGLPEAQLQAIRAGEPLRYGDFELVFIESRHAGATGGRPTGDIELPLQTPAHYMDYRQGGTWSVLIRHPQGTLLHHGSPGYIAGARAGYRADVVLMGVALIDDLDAYVAEVVDSVGARRVMPLHWDDFTRPLDQPLQPMPLVVNLPKFFGGMAARHPQISVQTLELREPVVLFP